jgi:hypothetical protein
MQPQDGFTGSAEDEKRLQLREESEKLLSNVVALRRTLWEMRANLHHLEKLCEEARDTRAEAGCLRDQINATAEKFGLQPIPAKDNRP